jgi:hypothetical protein
MWAAIKAQAALVAAACVSLVVTLITLRSTYDGFVGQALGTWSAAALFVLNAAFTILLVLALSAAFKPQRKVLYAVIVALGFQTLIATDLEVQPLAGTEQVGAAEKLNLGSVYNPIETWLAAGMEDPVKDAKRQDIAKLRAAYPTATDLQKLRADADDLLATDVQQSERETALVQVDDIIRDEQRSPESKVRDIALALYAVAGRDVVQDLVDGKNS